MSGFPRILKFLCARETLPWELVRGGKALKPPVIKMLAQEFQTSISAFAMYALCVCVCVDCLQCFLKPVEVKSCVQHALGPAW